MPTSNQGRGTRTNQYTLCTRGVPSRLPNIEPCHAQQESHPGGSLIIDQRWFRALPEHHLICYPAPPYPCLAQTVSYGILVVFRDFLLASKTPCDLRTKSLSVLKARKNKAQNKFLTYQACLRSYILLGDFVVAVLKTKIELKVRHHRA